MFQTFSFIMINKTFTFKLFPVTNSVLPAFLQTKQYITSLLESSMRHENSDFQTSWNLPFSALEPELSSVIWLILPSMLHQGGQFHNHLIEPV